MKLDKQIYFFMFLVAGLSFVTVVILTNSFRQEHRIHSDYSHPENPKQAPRISLVKFSDEFPVQLVDRCELNPVLLRRIKKDFEPWPVIRNTTSKGIPLTNLPQCSIVLRIANQQLYILSKKDPVSIRVKALKLQIHDLLATHKIPNVDLCISIQDFVMEEVDMHGAPVFAMDKLPKDPHILVPDFTFSSYPGSYKQGYVGMRKSLLKKKDEFIWRKRDRRVFFRGNGNSSARKKLYHLSKQYDKANTIFDVWVSTSTNLDAKEAMENRVFRTMEEHCNYTYLAHAEGLFYSSKLKYLMLCKSLVFWVHDTSVRPNKTIEFWYDLLVPWKHYVPINPSNATETMQIINMVRSNEDEAFRIAENGFRISRDLLTPWNIRCYWQHVLNEYASRADWAPNNDQFDLEDFETNIAKVDPS
eukprot:TRINITY_DN10312_c0_g1_i1.p1 TRINITY_DN10312_c0_g1~~TRINITY_DN10312_c0_g1_i1.p1  ORF type:complete len:416 (-),score=55.52 TRINITY_DN10312_c0_g1_i1:100-1347(-)